MHSPALCLFFILAQGTDPQVQSQLMTRDESVHIALKQNLDIQLEHINVASNRIQLDLARAAFEPSVDVYALYNETKKEPDDRLAGNDSIEETQNRMNLSYKKDMPFGLTYTINYDSILQTSTSESQFGKLVDTSANLELEQQLLRGFAFDAHVIRKDEYLAKADLRTAMEDFRIKLLDIMHQTEHAYYDLLAGHEKWKVAKQTLELAHQLHSENKVKVDVGTLAAIELANSEANLATRRKELIDAEHLIAAAEDMLKKTMNVDPILWEKDLIPTDPLKHHRNLPDPEQGYALARNNRSELIKIEQTRVKAGVNEKAERNQLLPSLSLKATYGFSGSSRPNEAEFRDASFSQALGVLERALFPTLQFELTGSWFPLNRQAKLRLSKARAEKRTAELNLRKTSLQIYEEVRGAMRDMASSLKSVLAREQVLRFREESLKAEQQKFVNGLSTSYRVSEEQERLALARFDLIQSKVDFLKAESTYFKATGTLPQARHINLKL